MSSFSLVEVFITVFIGMGPVKVLLIYIAKTKTFDKATKRAMVQRIVLVAGGVAIGLFILGALLQQILHFSIGALNIIGGLILLLLALNMVMGGKHKASGDGESAEDPMSIAISPLAIPLTLNPVGIVSVVVGSSQVQGLPNSIAVIAMIVVVMVIDYGVLSLSDRVSPYLSEATIMLFEVILGILLGALAIQLILNGLADVGAITLSGGGH